MMTGTGKKRKSFCLHPFTFMELVFNQSQGLTGIRLFPRAGIYKRARCWLAPLGLHLFINLRWQLVLLLLSYFLLWSSSQQLRPSFLCDLSRRWLKPYCHPPTRYFADTDKPIKEGFSTENLQSVIDCSGRLTPPAHTVNDLTLAHWPLCHHWDKLIAQHGNPMCNPMRHPRSCW